MEKLSLGDITVSVKLKIDGRFGRTFIVLIKRKAYILKITDGFGEAITKAEHMQGGHNKILHFSRPDLHAVLVAEADEIDPVARQVAADQLPRLRKYDVETACFALLRIIQGIHTPLPARRIRETQPGAGRGQAVDVE